MRNFFSIPVVLTLCILLFACTMGTIANAQDNPPASPVEVREATDSFHKSVIQAAVKAQRAGTLKRLDVVRLRVAMLSPAFRNHAQDLAVVQMSASGSETTPIGEDGQVDRASIDWAGLAAFLEKLLPLILQLIDAFSSFQNGEVLIFDPFQIRGPPAIELYC